MKHLLKLGLLSLTYHLATHSLWFFIIPIFTQKLRIISNKIVDCDGLITFWKNPRYPSFMPSLQPIIMWLLKFFGNKIIFSKQGKKLFQSGAVSTTFLFQSGTETVVSNWSMLISKWGKICFKVGQLLQNVVKCYFKVRHCLFQTSGHCFWDIHKEKLNATFNKASWLALWVGDARIFRSSRQRCCIKKGVRKNFSKFIGNHLCQTLFFNKAAGWGFQKDSGTGVFLWIL